MVAVIPTRGRTGDAAAAARSVLARDAATRVVIVDDNDHPTSVPFADRVDVVREPDVNAELVEATGSELPSLREGLPSGWGAGLARNVGILFSLLRFDATHHLLVDDDIELLATPHCADRVVALGRLSGVPDLSPLEWMQAFVWAEAGPSAAPPIGGPIVRNVADALARAESASCLGGGKPTVIGFDERHDWGVPQFASGGLMLIETHRAMSVPFPPGVDEDVHWTHMIDPGAAVDAEPSLRGVHRPTRLRALDAELLSRYALGSSLAVLCRLALTHSDTMLSSGHRLVLYRLKKEANAAKGLASASVPYDGLRGVREQLEAYSRWADSQTASDVALLTETARRFRDYTSCWRTIRSSLESAPRQQR
ncbi:hypothetical protein [Gordonia alkanivorans]|uniref:hypothetical protein n=1 Tax=Gordonia alkanivorans TaxID=84096 RepID=UPI0012F52270|nr:hypothetical protein [Gordonia alkanivorans]